MSKIVIKKFHGTEIVGIALGLNSNLKKFLKMNSKSTVFRQIKAQNGLNRFLNDTITDHKA